VRTLRDLERGNARPQQATVDLLVAALEVTGDERDQLVAASGRAAGPTGPVVNLPPRPVLVAGKRISRPWPPRSAGAPW